MMTHPLVVGFRDHFAKFVVHIKATWIETGKEAGVEATGFIGAEATGLDGNAYCGVITARHVVVDRPTSEVHWTLTRHSDDGHPAAVYEFASPGLIADDMSEFIRPPSPVYDAAAIIVPLDDSTNPPFFDPKSETTPKIIETETICATGAEIAWAGYPGLVTEELERPQLCLYRGMISATVLDTPAGTYLVDGHAAPGVSGGPVWHSDESGHRLVGVVSSYWAAGQAIPGFCHFAPVNMLISHMMNPAPPPPSR